MPQNDDTDSQDDPEKKVETPNGEDEISKDTPPNPDDTNDEEEDDAGDAGAADDDDSDSDDDQEEAEDFKPRFTQFLGGDESAIEVPKGYIEKLEESYGNSFNEFKKMRDDRDAWKGKAMARALGNPDTPETPDGDGKKDDTKAPAAPAKSLAERWAEQNMEKEWLSQYDDFAKTHPEINSDKVLWEKLDAKAAAAAAFIERTDGRIPQLKECLELAWFQMFGNQESKNSKKEQVAMAAKNVASSSKGKSAPAKPAPKPKYSDAQIEMAKKLDPKLEGKSRQEIETELAKFADIK